MRSMEGWVQAITPMVIAVVAFSFYLGEQGTELDGIKEQLTEIKNERVLDKELIAKTLVPSINGNRFAIIILCKDIEVVNANTDCASIFSNGI